MVALALLKTLAKLWYVAGTLAIFWVSTGGEIVAERSFASSVWIDIKCEAHCSWKSGGAHKRGSAYQ